MSKIKLSAKVAVAAILATGIFAGGSGPANAAPDSIKKGGVVQYDTGWG